MIRFLTAGESHGKGVMVIIEGMPAGVPIDLGFIQAEMQKRKKGAGSGGRQMIEDDATQVLSGVRFGKTLGSPITLYVENKDFKNWGDKMSEKPQPDDFVEKLKVVKPRPGHADLAGVQKYGFDDVRNVLERASARETTARVAAGAIFKQFLAPFGIEFASHTIQIGPVILNEAKDPYTFEDVKQSYTKNPETRCINNEASKQMLDAIHKARMEMNTLGGVIEVWAVNVPIGLGSYVHYDQKIDGQIAQALMSIPSVKAVEIGRGVAGAGMPGSEVHDEIFYGNGAHSREGGNPSEPGSPPSQARLWREGGVARRVGVVNTPGYFRKTNRAGGIEGGVTNGMPVIARVYHKPISTLYKPLKTVNIATKLPDEATIERSDICVVPRAGVIAESMLSFVIARAFGEKFGGDCLEDLQNTYTEYIRRTR